jgi:hypothetical protein
LQGSEPIRTMYQVIGLKARFDATFINARSLVIIGLPVLYLEVQIAITSKNTGRPAPFYFNN